MALQCNLFKDRPRKIMAFHQKPELQQERRIRHDRSSKIHPNGIPHGLAVVNGTLKGFI
jgi:hypothetical protein